MFGTGSGVRSSWRGVGGSGSSSGAASAIRTGASSGRDGSVGASSRRPTSGAGGEPIPENSPEPPGCRDPSPGPAGDPARRKGVQPRGWPRARSRSLCSAASAGGRRWAPTMDPPRVRQGSPHQMRRTAPVAAARRAALGRWRDRPRPGCAHPRSKSRVPGRSGGVAPSRAGRQSARRRAARPDPLLCLLLRSHALTGSIEAGYTC